MTRSRLAAALAAASFLVAVPAHADILSGCFGVAVVVCHPKVYTPVGTEPTEVPVCAGSCTYVNVPVPTVDPDGSVCLSWGDDRGGSYNTCNPI